MSEVGRVEFQQGDNPLDFLIEEEDGIEHSWEWAVVTSTSPLRIRFENEPNALNMTPDSLIPAPAVGTRVRVVIYGRSVLIVGAARGGLAAGGAGSFVPWGTPGTRVNIGDDSGEEPAYILHRSMPNYDGEAYFYLAADQNNVAGSIGVRQNGSLMNVLRVMGDGRVNVQKYGSGAGVRPIPYAVAAGSRAFSVSGGIGQVRITLPSGRFTQIPNLFVTGNSGVTTFKNAQIANPSTTSFDLVMQRDSTAQTTVYWMAVQMLPTNADG